MKTEQNSYPSESDFDDVTERENSQIANHQPPIVTPSMQNAQDAPNESFAIETDRKRSSLEDLHDIGEFSNPENQLPVQQQPRTPRTKKKGEEDVLEHYEGEERSDDQKIQPSQLYDKVLSIVDIEGCNCEAFKQIGKFYLPTFIQLDQQYFTSPIIYPENHPQMSARSKQSNLALQRKQQKKQMTDLCVEHVQRALSQLTEVHLKEEEYYPNIPQNRMNSICINQSKCSELIENTQNKMTDIEQEALNNSSLFQYMREQMSLPTNAYQFEALNLRNKSGLIYQQDFYLHDDIVYIVLQKSQVQQQQKICQLDILIFEYMYETQTCKQIHSKTLFTNYDFNLQFSPQKQAFIQNGQFLYYVRIKDQVPDRVEQESKVKKLFVLSRFDLQSHQEEYREIKWNVTCDLDSKIPFYALFFQKYDNICLQSNISNTKSYDSFIQTQPFIDEQLFLINQYIMVCYYEPHQSNYQPLKFEYEIRNLDYLQRSLCSNSIASSQFKHQVQALYFNQRSTIDVKGGPQAEFKAQLEFLRIELKTKSDEFQVDETLREGLKLVYQEPNQKEEREENNEKYKRIADEIKMARGCMYNDEDFPVQIDTITLNMNEDIVCQREYTPHLKKNEQYFQDLIYELEPKLDADGQPQRTHQSSASHHVHKDPNAPDPEEKEERQKPPKCLFLKDQINNKLLIVKALPQHDEDKRDDYIVKKFIILQADLHQNQLVPIDYEMTAQCMSKYIYTKSPLSFNQNYEGKNRPPQTPLSPQKDFINDVIQKEGLFRSPLFVVRESHRSRQPLNDKQRQQNRNQPSLLPPTNHTNLYLGQDQEYFIHKGQNKEISKYKIVHNDEFFTSNDEKLLPFQIEDFEEEEHKEEEVDDKQKKENWTAQIKTLEGKDLRIIPTRNQLKEFDQKEIPLLINSIKYQAYYLALLDLDNKSLIEVKQLDLNKKEFQDSNDPEIIYSSELYLQEKTDNENEQIIVICQNYHCVITFKNMQRIMLFELLMEWTPLPPPTPAKREPNAPLVKTSQFTSKIKLIGRKDFLSCINPDDLNKDSKFAFIERYQDKNGVIKGIKINVQQFQNIYVSYLIPNIPLEEENIIESEFAYTRYLKAYNQQSLEAVIVSVRLKNKIVQDNSFSYYDTNQLIRNAIKTCLNMIHIDIEDILYREIRFNDVFQSVDILYGMSVVDLFCNAPQRVQTCLIQTEEEYRRGQLSSMNQMLMENEYCDIDRFKKDLKVSNITRAKNELSFDFNYINVLGRCMKKSEPQILSADIILAHVFKQKYNINNQKALTMFLPHVIQAERQLKNYYQFLGVEIDDYKGDQSDQNKRLELNIKLKEVENLPRFSKKDMDLQVLNTKGQNPVDDLTDMIRDLVYNSVNIGTDFEVEHNYVDFRFLLFNQKIKKILFDDGEFECVEEITEFEIADYMLRIVEASGPKIAQYQIVRHIIDHQFGFTREYFIYQMSIYLAGFMTPFLIQICPIGNIGVILCLGCCCTTLVYFQIQEIVQIQDQGILGYVSDVWNFFDITGFLMFVSLIFTRLLQMKGDEDTPILYDYDHYDYNVHEFIEINSDNLDMVEGSVTLKILCCYVLIQSFIKIQFFFRIFESFGQLVQLMAQCIQDAKNFLGFMMSWIVVFWLQYMILGMEVSDEDYNSLPYEMRVLLQAWRNSIGDSSAPKYTKWVDRGAGLFMISLIWLLWIVQQILILIMMLNFFVAVIQNSYEKVMNQSDINRYMHRSSLNRECRLLNRKKLSPIDILVFSVTKEKDNADDWEGFVTTIKQFVAKAITTIKTKVSGENAVRAQANYKVYNEKVEKIEEKLDSQFGLTKEMIKQLATVLDAYRQK